MKLEELPGPALSLVLRHLSFPCVAALRRSCQAHRLLCDGLVEAVSAFPWRSLTLPLYTRGSRLRGVQPAHHHSLPPETVRRPVAQELNLHLRDPADLHQLSRLSNLQYLLLGSHVTLEQTSWQALATLPSLVFLQLGRVGRREQGQGQAPLHGRGQGLHLRLVMNSCWPLALHFPPMSSCPLCSCHDTPSTFKLCLHTGVFLTASKQPAQLCTQQQLSQQQVPQGQQGCAGQWPGPRQQMGGQGLGEGPWRLSRPGRLFPRLHSLWLGGGLQGVAHTSLKHLGPALGRVRSLMVGQLAPVAVEPACINDAGVVHLLTGLPALASLHLVAFYCVTSVLLEQLVANNFPCPARRGRRGARARRDACSGTGLPFNEKLGDDHHSMSRCGSDILSSCDSGTEEEAEGSVVGSARGSGLPMLKSIVLDECPGIGQAAEVDRVLMLARRRGSVTVRQV
ncbi:hypothetical protein V8C86DRAFT_3171249 [Haematococcus lacustris]